MRRRRRRRNRFPRTLENPPVVRAVDDVRPDAAAEAVSDLKKRMACGMPHELPTHPSLV